MIVLKKVIFTIYFQGKYFPGNYIPGSRNTDPLSKHRFTLYQTKCLRNIEIETEYVITQTAYLGRNSKRIVKRVYKRQE